MKYAVLFPGQGSQTVGMLAAIAAREAVVRETLAQADRSLGWSVSGLIANGPVEELNRTERTQPALLACGVALWRAWQARVPAPPAAMAGHSLGEYAALVASGSLDFGEALRLVELRGQLMQQAVPDGAGGMAAVIGLDDGAVEQLCGKCDAGVLEPVNYNAPGQVVVAGETAALNWLEANGKPAGARMIMRLPVSVPSHCSLMRDAARRLGERLAQVPVKAPSIPVLHNLDAAARSAPDAIRDALKDQLHRPVRWTQTVQALAGQGIGLFFECGPGKVLAGLNKRIGKLVTVSLEEPAGFDQAVLEVSGATT